jgi:6-phosphogluconolactonase
MMKKTEVKIYPDPESVAKVFAADFFRMVSQSQSEQFHVALSGGSTPKILFQVLAKDYKNTMPWNKIHFWWGDERCVSPENEQSNFKTTHQFLFNQINIPTENIHRILGENNPELEAIDYGNKIAQSLELKNGWPVFDLIILGMGADGHTASIFPNQMELLVSAKICEVATHPESGQQRISLTGKVINNADLVCFLVTGPDKRFKVSEILTGKPEAEQYPAFHIKPANGKLIWYLDKAAYSETSGV